MKKIDAGMLLKFIKDELHKGGRNQEKDELERLITGLLFRNIEQWK